MLHPASYRKLPFTEFLLLLLTCSNGYHRSLSAFEFPASPAAIGSRWLAARSTWTNFLARPFLHSPILSPATIPASWQETDTKARRTELSIGRTQNRGLSFRPRDVISRRLKMVSATADIGSSFVGEILQRSCSFRLVARSIPQNSRKIHGVCQTYVDEPRFPRCILQQTASMVSRFLGLTNELRIKSRKDAIYRRLD